MNLTFFDYIVLLVVYMFVSLRGDKLAKIIKIDKLTKMIPLAGAESGALVNGIIFVLLLIVITAFANKVAGASGLGMSDIKEAHGGILDTIKKKLVGEDRETSKASTKKAPVKKAPVKNDDMYSK